ncbi:hypothetical protein GGR95_001025 [Sulfitobacter undariae]|uniref:Uncharacterized protein n=1 Tax=Sulfitobacter undariae TaxID=1563671 RepID=A0A7W6E279_9RHOB|nr:hypothetical protein [Sulfitobacter undariae]MBB3993397.1 hypothetical protein [Sulfitobacter undariae]
MRLFVIGAAVVLACVVLVSRQFSSSAATEVKGTASELRAAVAGALQGAGASQGKDKSDEIEPEVEVVIDSAAVPETIPAAGGAEQTDPDTQDWQSAAASNDPMHVVAYLSGNPAGKYRDEALALLAELLANDEITRNSPELLVTQPSAVDFGGALNAATLEVLLTSSPKYPPIEGLRAELWENKSCKNCHNWDIESLCTQATFYQKPSFDPKTESPHPFGVDFRVSLRDWSVKGCQ